MSIPNNRKKRVRPIHPGEMLREDFLPDYGDPGYGHRTPKPPPEGFTRRRR